MGVAGITLVAVLAACGSAPRSSAPTTTEDEDEPIVSSINPGNFRVVRPGECEDKARVAGFCGSLNSLEGQFVWFPGAVYASDKVITILPDGRMRLTVRLTADYRKESSAELNANTIRGAGWTELPGSELLHQVWERDQGDVTGTFRLFVDYGDGPLLDDGTRASVIEGRIETVGPVVANRRLRTS